MEPLEDVRRLIVDNKRYDEYSADAFVSYCEEIRTSINALPQGTRCPDVERFFQKKFVEEMEVIARIWKHQFGNNGDGFKIQYMKADPPDGTITRPTGHKLLIECTTAVDRRWENFALEQWRKHQRLVSLSGYSSKDLGGNRLSGYTLEGFNIDDPAMQEFLVEADDEEMVIQRHREQITEAIEKKLAKSFQGGENWLSVFVNEFVFPDWHHFMRPVLEDLFEQYRQKLLDKNIEAVYFVGNSCDEAGLMSFHPTA